MSEYTPKKMDVEHAYVAQAMRSDTARLVQVTREFRGFLAEVERKAAEKAWWAAAAAFVEAHDLNNFDPWSYMPGNPYLKEEVA